MCATPIRDRDGSSSVDLSLISNSPHILARTDIQHETNASPSTTLERQWDYWLQGVTEAWMRVPRIVGVTEIQRLGTSVVSVQRGFSSSSSVLVPVLATRYQIQTRGIYLCPLVKFAVRIVYPKPCLLVLELATSGREKVILFSICLIWLLSICPSRVVGEGLVVAFSPRKFSTKNEKSYFSSHGGITCEVEWRSCLRKEHRVL